MTDEPRVAEVLLGQGVPESTEQGLAAVLTGYGFVVRTRRALVHRGATELHWVVLIALPLQAFLSGLGAEAVRDAYVGVKSLVRRALGSADGEPAGAEGPLVLQDEASGLRIVLERDLPEKAYEQLLGMDLTRFRRGPLHYDRAQRRWRSELDEAGGAGA